MTVRILTGDARDLLRTLPDCSVQCCVSSPPYFGLRDYGVAGQIGLELTPEAYVEEMVAVFREVRRALRDDGTLWLNLGDSYNSGTAAVRKKSETADHGYWEAGADTGGMRINAVGYKPKDLMMMPARVALALQAPFYGGRIKAERDRVWMAAMIDGEGTICGFRHERPDGNVRTGSLVFITNSSRAILAECDRIWPGARYIDTLKAGDEVLGAVATKDCFRWQIQGAEDRSLFLREIFPYLVEKRQQAAAGYAMAELSIASKKNGRSGDSADTKAKRDLLAALMSDLNQGRPYVVPSWLKAPPGVKEPGWYLRSEIIWAKNNPMPESCTDRPTSSHEKVFLFSKSARYFYDADALREPQDTLGERHEGKSGYREGHPSKGGISERQLHPLGRNIRNVWTIASSPFPEAHFATFPPALAERCIKAGTSEAGACPTCGVPLNRVVGKGEPDLAHQRACGGDANGQYHGSSTKGHAAAGVQDASAVKARILAVLGTKRHLGWQQTCSCVDLYPRDRQVVLDPFAGAGTTGLVADRLGRDAILIELNPGYAAMARRRIEGDAPLLADVAD